MAIPAMAMVAIRVGVAPMAAIPGPMAFRMVTTPRWYQEAMVTKADLITDELPVLSEYNWFTNLAPVFLIDGDEVVSFSPSNISWDIWQPI